MAKKVSLNVTSKKGGGKTITETIPYINPDADNNALTDFSLAFSALSDNTISAVQRVVKYSLDDSPFADDNDVDAYLAAIAAGADEPVIDDSDFNTYLDGVENGTTSADSDSDFDAYLDSLII